MTQARGASALKRLMSLVTGRRIKDSLNWTSKLSFTLEGHKFIVPFTLEDLIINADAQDGESLDSFYLAKHSTILANYYRLFDEEMPRTILDLGIGKGGSAPFLQLLLKPERLLALELSPERIGKLDRFIEDNGFSDSMKVVFGVDQGDVPRVRECCEGHFGRGRTIDLVIDDASHLLESTRRSFETVFPMIRPGGSYIVEDYAAVPIMLKRWLDKARDDDHYTNLVKMGMTRYLDGDHQPLHVLAVECMLASIVAPGYVKRVEVTEHWLRVVRGGKDIPDPENFRLAEVAVDHFNLTRSEPVEQVRPYLSEG